MFRALFSPGPKTNRKSDLFRYRGGRYPSLVQQIRQTLGQCLRETGRALDRMGWRLESFTWLPDKYIGIDPPVPFQDFLSRHVTQLPLLHSGKPVVHEKVAFIAPCATLLGNVRVDQNASIWYGAVLRGDTSYNAASFQQSDQEILQHAQEALPQLLLRDGSEDQSPLDTQQSKEDDDDIDEEDHDDEKTGRRRKKPKGIFEKWEDSYDNAYCKGGGIYVGPDTNLQDGVLVTARDGDTVIGQGVTVGHLAQLHSCKVQDYALIGMGSILSEGCHVETEALVAAGAVVPAHTTIGAGELWVGSPARKIRDLTAEEREKLHYQSSEYVQLALSQRHVMELGGNLTKANISLMEAVRHNLQHEYETQETHEERIYRTNKWMQTIYRPYLKKPPPRPEALEAGEEDATPPLLAGVDGGVVDTNTMDSTDSSLPPPTSSMERGTQTGNENDTEQSSSTSNDTIGPPKS